MATAAQLLTAMAGVITTQVPGATRLGSDYRVDLEDIALGATRFQLAMGPAGEFRTSNDNYVVMAGRISVYHRLADPDDERAYTEGAMQTTLDALAARSTWQGLSEVDRVDTDPAYEVERVVNVIATNITLAVVLAL